MELETIKVELIHEWIAAMAGSEKLFAEMAAAIPGANLAALAVSPTAQSLLDRQVRTNILAPVFCPPRPWAVPLLPLASRILRKSGSDVYITSSHAFIKLAVPTEAIHLCYTHTPARFLWATDADDRGNGFAARALAPMLRRLDRQSAGSVTSFAANSNETRMRIERAYSRSSRVIFPPVDTEFYSPCTDDSTEVKCAGVLSVGRLVSYKRFDLAIEVAAKLGRPLSIVGEGPDRPRLERLASESSSPVRFLGHVDDVVVRDLMRTCDAFLFLGYEDFGIVAAEAMSCGAPIVGIDRGGATDIVSDSRCGRLAGAGDVDAMADALLRVLQMEDHTTVRHEIAVERFSKKRFRKEIFEWLGEVLVAEEESAARTAEYENDPS